MKSVTIGIFLFLGYNCSRKESPKSGAAVTNSHPIETGTTQLQKILVDFNNDIQPILKSHCMPCHFPGGKLYGKLPFDKPQTIIDHPRGIFKRIKDPEEVKKLKAFMELAAS